MSEPAELNLSPPTFAVRNTVGKGNEQISKNLNRPASDAGFREYCNKHYHQLLPLIAEKVHQETMQQEKLKEVKPVLTSKDAQEETRRRKRFHNTPSPELQLKEDTAYQRLDFTRKRAFSIFNTVYRTAYIRPESMHVKETQECMIIFGFMHGITNPELIKRLHDNIPKSVDEMMRVTKAFLKGEVAASNQARKNFWHGSNKKQGENKILIEGKISGISRDQSGDVTSSHSLQNPHKKFWL
nr:reverse transcriptase domain-containing protein [Tanacetum cinerariifolium]